MYHEPLPLGDWPNAAPNAHQGDKLYNWRGIEEESEELPAQHKQRLWRGHKGWGCMQLIQMNNYSWLQGCHGKVPDISPNPKSTPKS